MNSSVIRHNDNNTHKSKNVGTSKLSVKTLAGEVTCPLTWCEEDFSGYCEEGTKIMNLLNR